MAHVDTKQFGWVLQALNAGATAIGLIAASSAEAQQLRVSSTTATPGSGSGFVVSLDSQGKSVVAAEITVSYDRINTPVRLENGKPACQTNPAIAKAGTFVFLPRGCADSGNTSACLSVLGVIYSLSNLTPLASPTWLFGCNIDIPATAPFATFRLAALEPMTVAANGVAWPSTTAVDGTISVGTTGCQASAEAPPASEMLIGFLVLGLLILRKHRCSRQGTFLSSLLVIGLVTLPLAGVAYGDQGQSHPVKAEGRWWTDDGVRSGKWSAHMRTDERGQPRTHIRMHGFSRLDDAELEIASIPQQLARRLIYGNERVKTTLRGKKGSAIVDATIVGQTLTATFETDLGVTGQLEGWWERDLGVTSAPVDEGESTPHVAGNMVEKIRNGEPQRLLVQLHSDSLREQAKARRAAKKLSFDDAEIAELNAHSVDQIRTSLLQKLPQGEFQLLASYRNLATVSLLVKTETALDILLGAAEVRRISEIPQPEPQFGESLPLIGQPSVEVAGYLGQGAIVGVIDSGILYTREAFGPCRDLGVPLEEGGTCRVIQNVELARRCSGNLSISCIDQTGCPAGAGECVGDGSDSDDGARHGSRVAEVIARTAPGAQIIALDVHGAPNSIDLNATLAAIDWAITQRTMLGRNIVALNESSGSGQSSIPCTAGFSGIQKTHIDQARDAGILYVAASGNQALTTSISTPACIPGVVSVGAVYDSNLGAESFSGACDDPNAYYNKPACFSNSASFLTLLAPGARIDFDDDFLRGWGTSYAAPFVTAAVAILRSPLAFPTDSLPATVERLRNTGINVTDPKSGFMQPRIDILRAVQSAPRCTGDCNVDGRVRVDEITRGVSIAFLSTALSTCPRFDADFNGSVTIDELVASVGLVGSGCFAP